MMNLDVNSDTRKNRVYATMYFKRFFSLRQMDIDYSFSQMIQICLSPTKVYKMTAWRKQTKNQWARDDPSFMLIALLFVAMSAVAFSTALRPLSITYLLKSMIQSVVVSLLAGLTICTVSWYISNHYMRIQRPHSPEQSVEWLYTLDIHFNSFIPLFLLLGVVQYLLLPFLVKNGWLSCILSDCLFMLAIGVYCYITFLGFLYLPFIKTPFVILIMGGCVICVLLVMMVFGVNLTTLWITKYYM